MKRFLPFVILVAALLALTACGKLNFITDSDIASEPTVYAKVLKAPNPALFGHWSRPQPSEYYRPWSFSYYMVEKNGKVAVYYLYDSKRANSFKGWSEFVVNGDSMFSPLDGSTYFVRDGKVYMRVAGRDVDYEMTKSD